MEPAAPSPRRSRNPIGCILLVVAGIYLAYRLPGPRHLLNPLLGPSAREREDSLHEETEKMKSSRSVAEVEAFLPRCPPMDRAYLDGHLDDLRYEEADAKQTVAAIKEYLTHSTNPSRTEWAEKTLRALERDLTEDRLFAPVAETADGAAARAYVDYCGENHRDFPLPVEPAASLPDRLRAVILYLSRFPHGPHAGVARALLVTTLAGDADSDHRAVGEILQEAIAAGGVVRISIDREKPSHEEYVEALLADIALRLRIVGLTVERWKEGSPKPQLTASFEVKEDRSVRYGPAGASGEYGQSVTMTLDRPSWSRTLYFKSPESVAVRSGPVLPNARDVARDTAEGVKGALPIPW